MPDGRVRFPAGKQTEFMIAAIEKGGGIDALAKLIGVSKRTIRDWRREKYLISNTAVNLLSEKYKINLNSDITLEKPFWYAIKGARKGGLASIRKQHGEIGNPIIRKQNWHKWWEREGKFKTNLPNLPLPFHKSPKSIDLAEFMGIAMGDGGMSHNQIIITLHHIDDLEYSRFVVSLMEKLFHVKPAVYHSEKNSVNDIVISRVGLVQYLHELGLPIGNKVKQNFDVPDWIKENREYMTACVRGLVDTDGSIFTHSYRVNGKLYHYKKISFCSASYPLKSTVMAFLQSFGFHVRASRGIDLRIESQKDVKGYMDLIGSHNPKHLRRYANYDTIPKIKGEVSERLKEMVC